MRKDNMSVMVLLVALILSCSWRRSRSSSQEKQILMVGITLVPHALALGAVCLDGSPPAYHIHRGFGSGSNNWLLQFEGGGWCNDVPSCLERSRTRHGSSRYMNKLAPFSGILSNDPTMNPDFYNWNRVKLRYCDGASFTGDSVYQNSVNRCVESVFGCS